MLIFLIIGCVVFGVILYLVFSGVLSDGEERPSFGGGVPRMSGLPAGCLIALLVASAIWFVLWGVVLLLALRLLNTPL